METLLVWNKILAVSGIILFVIAASMLLDLQYKRILESLILKFGLFFAFLITSSSTLLSLVYSDYFRLIPCGLCWFERIALFPQVLILGVALYYKDTNIARSGIALSIFGGVVALYHHYIQMGGSEFVKCPAAGADCAKRFLFEFDLITFPLLAAITFFTLTVLYVYILRSRN